MAGRVPVGAVTTLLVLAPSSGLARTGRACCLLLLAVWLCRWCRWPWLPGRSQALPDLSCFLARASSRGPVLVARGPPLLGRFFPLASSAGWAPSPSPFNLACHLQFFFFLPVQWSLTTLPLCYLPIVKSSFGLSFLFHLDLCWFLHHLLQLDTFRFTDGLLLAISLWFCSFFPFLPDCSFQLRIFVCLLLADFFFPVGLPFAFVDGVVVLAQPSGWSFFSFGCPFPSLYFLWHLV